MGTPKISVITASARPDGLPMVSQCLAKQTFQDFEWLLVLPEDKDVKIKRDNVKLLHDPPRREGDFYRLNGAWNVALKEAKGDLLVFIVDWVWFFENALELCWQSYEKDPKCCLTSFGHHYRTVGTTGRPEVQWTQDPRLEWMERLTSEQGMPPEWMELAFAALPRQDVLDVGGFDEKYDAVAGMSEKELCLRMFQQGNRFALHIGLEIRNYTHPRMNYTENWDTAAAKAKEMFKADAGEIMAGRRSKIPFEFVPFLFAGSSERIWATCAKCNKNIAIDLSEHEPRSVTESKLMDQVKQHRCP